MSDTPKSLKIARELNGLETASKAWGLRVVDAGPGLAIAEMIVSEEMLNGLGTAHGGMIFALADTALPMPAIQPISARSHSTPPLHL